MNKNINIFRFNCKPTDLIEILSYFVPTGTVIRKIEIEKIGNNCSVTVFTYMAYLDFLIMLETSNKPVAVMNSDNSWFTTVEGCRLNHVKYLEQQQRKQAEDKEQQWNTIVNELTKE